MSVSKWSLRVELTEIVMIDAESQGEGEAHLPETSASDVERLVIGKQQFHLGRRIGEVARGGEHGCKLVRHED